MSDGAGLQLEKCLACHARFVPADQTCPRCGSRNVETYASPGLGTVLAATALEVPPPGWDRPHPLALVEVEDGVRLLVIPELPLPPVGAAVQVRRDGGTYRSSTSSPGKGERGEGDVPGAG